MSELLGAPNWQEFEGDIKPPDTVLSDSNGRLAANADELLEDHREIAGVVGRVEPPEEVAIHATETAVLPKPAKPKATRQKRGSNRGQRNKLKAKRASETVPVSQSLVLDNLGVIATATELEVGQKVIVSVRSELARHRGIEDKIESRKWYR